MGTFLESVEGAFAMWYMDSANAITEDPVTLKGDVMDVFFNGQDFEGRVADLRVKVTRKGNDLYHGMLAERQNGGWKQLAGLDYVP
jgi:hypothetical protein